MNQQTPDPKWERWISIGIAVLMAVLSSLGIRVAWPPEPPSPAVPQAIERRLSETEHDVKVMKAEADKRHAEIAGALRAKGLHVPPTPEQ